MNDRNRPCFCGSGKKFKHCHGKEFDHYWRNWHILLKTPEQIAGIRKACQTAAHILDETCKRAKEGVTTDELNDFAHDLHRQLGAKPAPLGYGDPPYPKSICTSLNDVVCHGIPDATPLRDGDILNIDVTAIVDGYYGDCSRMVSIGNISAEKALVIKAAHGSLLAAIDILRPGIPLNAIGEAIEAYAIPLGCSVVHQFVGHGVGVLFHEEPQIFHNRNRCTTPLAAGMTFTIEPMINAGLAEAQIDSHDRWTARTIDGKASAQWEHTILITETGHEILTIA